MADDALRSGGFSDHLLRMLHNMIFVGTVSVIDLWPSKLVNI